MGCYYTAQPSLKLGILLPQPPNAAVTWANVPGVKESSFLIVLCCMYLHMLVYMHTDVPRPEVNAPVPSSVTPYLTFWDQVSHRTWSSLTGLDRWPSSPRDLPVSDTSALQLHIHTAMLRFSCVFCLKATSRSSWISYASNAFPSTQSSGPKEDFGSSLRASIPGQGPFWGLQTKLVPLPHAWPARVFTAPLSLIVLITPEKYSPCSISTHFPLILTFPCHSYLL